MAPTAMEEHVFQLSTIDQALARTYIRCCVGFSCDRINIKQIEGKLTAAVKRTVIALPILAGTVKPVVDSEDQKNRLEVSATLNNVINFNPTFTRLSLEEFSVPFMKMERSGMPPSALLNEFLTPLPDVPDPSTAAAFAIRMNQIQGGIVVVIYLHHAVADITSMKTILSLLSADMLDRTFSNIQLRNQALEYSRLHDQLSVSRGIQAAPSYSKSNSQPADLALGALTLSPQRWTCRVLSFKLDLIYKTQALINTHLREIRGDPQTHISGFDTLAALLWKAICRARKGVDAPANDGTTNITTVITPNNIRARTSPQLAQDYFGNATLCANTTTTLEWLTMPYSVSDLALIARLVKRNNEAVGEHKVRETIAEINESLDVQAAPIGQVASASDILISSWEDLSLKEASLGLGLGDPECFRKLGRTITSHECIVHPPTKAPRRWTFGAGWIFEQDLWEVTVEVPETIMEAMLGDEKFMEFVKFTV